MNNDELLRLAAGIQRLKNELRNGAPLYDELDLITRIDTLTECLCNEIFKQFGRKEYEIIK